MRYSNQASSTPPCFLLHHFQAPKAKMKLINPMPALPTPRRAMKDHTNPICHPKIRPVHRFTCQSGSGIYSGGWDIMGVTVFG